MDYPKVPINLPGVWNKEMLESPPTPEQQRLIDFHERLHIKLHAQHLEQKLHRRQNVH